MSTLDNESVDKEPLTKGKGDINHTQTKGRDYSSIIDEKAIKRKKYIKWGIIIALIIIAVILAIVLPITLSKGDSSPTIFSHYNPYHLSLKDVTIDTNSFDVTLRAPAKYDRDLHLVAIDRINPILKDGSKKLSVDSKGIPHGPNNVFSQNIEFKMDMNTWRVAHLTVTDADNVRYSIPESAVPKPKVDETMRLDMLGFTYNMDPFYIKFSDPTNPENVFVSTQDQSLVVMDKFIQMDFLLPSQRLFGFGERIHDFQLDEGTWTMWAIGLDSPVDDGKGRKGVYGVHPFVLVQTATKGDFMGIYFRNSNAQSPVLKYTDGGKSILSYITTGGQIEAYFFIHGSAKDIIAQYQSMFGKPNLPPFWSLGWQQASWKYIDQDTVTDVIDKYAQNQMPLETIYLDIPYMKNYADFTVDLKAFNNIPALADRLHAAGQRLVVIVDAAISAEDLSDNNAYYTMGNEDNTFIKSGLWRSTKYNNNLISQVWPKQAVFMDWFNKKCMNVWSKGLYDLYQQTKYDGLWIDMNEPTTFQHGETKPDDAIPVKPKLGDSYSWYYEFESQKEMSTFKLPFIPRYNPSASDADKPYSSNFDYMTLSLNSTVSGLNDEVQYNVHSLYGHMMAMRTQQFLKGDNAPRKDDRTFILSRSTFTSSGQFASHWLGDNWRSYDYMQYSIAGIMNMNMFGIPHAGADVCGFFGEKKDDEMCARWIQLATFYPLARAHQNLTWNDQPSERTEPYQLAGKFKDWAKFAIRERYRYLREFYTCLYETNQNGGTCFDPLFFHYPQDDNVYKNYSQSFIYSNAIKVSPVLNKNADGQTTFKSYFPKGMWVSLNNFASIINSTGALYDLPTDNNLAHAHLKPGSLISRQNFIKGDGSLVMTTNDLLTQPISILVNRDETGSAKGSLLLDEGISVSEFTANAFEYYTILHQSQSIQFQIKAGLRGQQNNIFQEAVILNAGDLKAASFACYMGPDKTFTDLKVKYDDINNALRITTMSDTKFSQIMNIYYGMAGDINLCDASTFKYKIAKGQAPPDLTKNTASVILEHMAGTLPNIQVSMRALQGSIVNVKWTWATVPAGYKTPAEVPNDVVNTDIPLTPTKLQSFLSYSDAPFQINFKYRTEVDPSNVLTIKGMMFDQYLNWIDVKVNTMKEGDFKGILGLGERANKDFFYKDGVYSMWARDQPTPDETGTLPAANMYGTHPFYMYKHKAGAWVGVFYKLAHAQDWWIKNDVNAGTVDISTVATGGVADIYVMQGRTPDSVVSNYHSIVGAPVLVPQWALGWNQCRWGYRSTDQLQEVLDGYSKFNLPLDVQWSDIDYLDQYRDFQYDKDPQTFQDLPKFISKLHNLHMKYVPILDAAIAYRPTKGEYPAFYDGKEKDLFVKINNATTYIGQVWPNDVAYPDFFHPATSAWWKSNLDALWNQLPFDGIWEDMNEASNFCNGFCYDSQAAMVSNPVQNKLKYIPTGRDLETKSMPLDATHYNGLTQLDTHNYFGTQEVKVTDEWFKSKQMRTFIIDRSSFSGMGKYGSRWLGDNFSEEKFMGYSVSGTMLMNIFGITFTGSDICGFIGDTTPQLCAKWHVLGAFYPFSRNHNNWGQVSQEPYVYGDRECYTGKKCTDIMRTAIKMKYSLIRYYYTNLFMISTQGSGTFYKPLFFEFPEDPNAYNSITYNIMLGQALKLSINSESLSQETTNFYFPEGIWCDIIALTPCMTSTGQIVSMSNKLDDFGLHLRQGFIVPFQDMNNNGDLESIRTTYDLQRQPIDLHVLGEPNQPGTPSWRSQGAYVNDDGVQVSMTGNFNAYSFVVQSRLDTITMQVFNSYQATNYINVLQEGCWGVNQNDFLSTVYFYNAKAFQNDKSYKVTADLYSQPVPLTFTEQATYDATTDRLVFKIKNPVCMTNLKTITFTKA